MFVKKILVLSLLALGFIPSLASARDPDTSPPEIVTLTLSPSHLSGEIYQIRSPLSISSKVRDLESGMDPAACRFYINNDTGTIAGPIIGVYTASRVANTGSCSLSDYTVPSGTTNITLEANNLDGLHAIQTVRIELDNNAPDVQVRGLAATQCSVVFDVPYVVVSEASALENVRLHVTDNPADSGTWRLVGEFHSSPIRFDGNSLSPAIGNGTYYFVVTGTDVLGNSEFRPLLSEGNTVITVTPSCGDTVAPVVAITSPANAASSTDTTQTLRATTDENATCSFRLENDTGAFTPMTTTGAREHTHSLTGLSVSAHRVYVRCSDAAGNTRTESSAFTVNAAGSPTVGPPPAPPAGPTTGGSGAEGGCSMGGAGSAFGFLNGLLLIASLAMMRVRRTNK